MGSGWAGLGRADPDTWHAVMLPCCGRGPLLGFVHSVAHTAWFTVDQRSWSMDLQQGAWWTKSTISSPWLGSRAPSSRLGGRRGGCSPVFFRGGAPVGDERLVSPHGSADVRLERGKASPGHGDCVCGVKGRLELPQGVGHGDRRLGVAVLAGEPLVVARAFN